MSAAIASFIWTIRFPISKHFLANSGIRCTHWNLIRTLLLLRSLPATPDDKAHYLHSYDAVINTLDKLSLYTTATSEVAKLYLFLPNIDRIMTSEGTYTPRTFFTYYGDGSYEQWRETLRENRIYSLTLWDFNANQNDFSKLNMVKTFYDGYGEKGLIIANLNRNMIRNMFDGTKFSAERKIYMTDENMRVLSSNTEQIGMQLSQEYEQHVDADNGSFFTRDDFVCYRRLTENNVYLVIVTPNEVIYRNVNKITLAAYTFLLIMMVVGVGAIILCISILLPTYWQDAC